MPQPAGRRPSPELLGSLRRLGVVGSRVPPMVPLAGGVSSETWRIDRADGPVVAKRALSRLRVEARWDAPVARTRFEAAWLALAADLAPGLGPGLVAFDPAPGGALVTTYEDRPSWKTRLLAGDADAGLAGDLGRRLGALHAAAARRPSLAHTFDASAVFAVMRVEPYFGAVARAHPDLAAAVGRVRDELGRCGRSVIHGDVTPKNVLAGAGGPVLVDAECATWGDPAFDLALCSAHLMLKCRWRPDRSSGYLACLDALAASYLDAVDWEDPIALEGRATRLAAVCLLARVDGMSPVEYLDDDARRATRHAARGLVARCPDTLAGVRAGWADGVGAAAG